MKLCTIRTALTISRKPFSFVKGSKASDPIDYLLCNQCKVHFSDEYTDKANGPQYIWPGFHWSILQCKDIHNYCSSEFIWVFSPLGWREWCFDDDLFQFLVYYNSISIRDPQPIFMDRTKDLETCNEGIKFKN